MFRSASIRYTFVIYVVYIHRVKYVLVNQWQCALHSTCILGQSGQDIHSGSSVWRLASVVQMLIIGD